MYSVIMGHLGSDAVAANSIAGIVRNITACVCLGIGSGGGILIGNDLGRGQEEHTRLMGDYLCHLSVVAGVISGSILMLIRPLILKAAGLSAVSQEYLSVMLIMCAGYMVGKSVNSTVIAGIFCAGGDTRFGLICDAVVMWLIVIPISLACAFYWQIPLPYLYFIISLDEFIKLPAVYSHYRKYGWVRNLTRN